MKNSVLTVVAAALLVAGCQKNDLVPERPAAPNPASSSALAAGCDVINFEQASGLLTSVTSANNAGPIGLVSRNFNHPLQPVAAMVFESSSAVKPGVGSPSYGGYDPYQQAAEDLDLGTPNSAHGGYGRGAAGAATNTVALDNILVIQNFIWGVPNDDDGRGFITFNFSSIGPVSPTSLTLIDVEFSEGESGTVELWATDPAAPGAPLAVVPFVNTGSNGVATLNLGTTAGVNFVKVNINGSIGIDNLAFCRSVPRGCTYTQGYWKNHPESWPVAGLTLGSTYYTKQQLLAILKSPVKGNGLISLAHQLIAAKLNVANGSSAAAVQAAILEADGKIGALTLPGGYLAPASVSGVATTLDRYNNGLIGPGHCD